MTRQATRTFLWYKRKCLNHLEGSHYPNRTRSFKVRKTMMILTLQNCPPAVSGDESENEVEAGDFEAYDPLDLNWEIGGDDLPEPVVEDFDGKPSWDPAQPPSAFTCFVMLFPMDLLASVAAETNRYGKWLQQTAMDQGRRPKVWVDTDVDELCRFFGLIIVHTLHTWFFFVHIFFRAKTCFYDCSHIVHISGYVNVQIGQSKTVLAETTLGWPSVPMVRQNHVTGSIRAAASRSVTPLQQQCARAASWICRFRQAFQVTPYHQQLGRKFSKGVQPWVEGQRGRSYGGLQRSHVPTSVPTEESGEVGVQNLDAGVCYDRLLLQLQRGGRCAAR